MPKITSLHIFPIKSFDGVAVEAVELRKNGSFKHDREYKFVDESGNQVNSLDLDNRMYKVRVSFEDNFRLATFSTSDNLIRPQSYNLHTQANEAAIWMGKALGKNNLRLLRDDGNGFCDD